MTHTQPLSWNDRLLRLQSVGSFLAFPEERGGASLPIARILGAMVSILMLGTVLALLPLRGYAASMADLIACAGILLFNVMILAGSQFLRGRGYELFAVISLLIAGCFSVLAGISYPVTACVAVLLVLDYLLHRKTVNLIEIGLYGGVATSVFIFALMQAWPASSASLMLFAIYIPVLAGLYSRTNQLYEQGRQRGENSALDSAFLTAALESNNQILLMVDRSGMIEASTLHLNEGAQKRQGEPAEYDPALLAPGLYLGDAILISDRVALFQAISDAIHKGITREDVLIRLREVMPEGGYTHPPCFIAHAMRVTAMKEISSRAIITLKPIEEAAAQPAQARPSLQISARAVHDFVSPFNASLGFLEILMDEKLAPKGEASSREFAQKAHQAVMAAFRNATLLAKAITVQDHAQNKPEGTKQMFSALLHDAMREMGMHSQAGGNAVHIECGSAGDRFVIEPDKLRFALQVMLTIGLNAAKEGDKLALVAAADDEADCQIMLRISATARGALPLADGFEQVLEKMMMELTGGQFSRHQTHGYILTIPRAFSQISRAPPQNANIGYLPRQEDAAA